MVHHSSAFRAAAAAALPNLNFSGTEFSHVKVSVPNVLMKIKGANLDR
jgi:hypothetical protein